MPAQRDHYSIQIAGVKRQLPLFEVQPGIRIAVLNILGDTELVQACAKELSGRLAGVDHEVLVTAEAKSIPLIHALSVESGKPYVVLRKIYKPYMGETIQAETVSITTGKPQSLYLDEKDQALLTDRQVVLLDDVISTGSTLKGMRKVVNKAGAEIAAEAAILTEGDPRQWSHVIALGHIPVFKS